MTRKTAATVTAWVFAIALTGTSAAQESTPELGSAASAPESDLAFPYRLYPTTNIWTHILLDTRNGRAWQVQYSVGDAPSMKVDINKSSLLPEGAAPENGRFALYPTLNMHTFLLMDRVDSRIWQLQWSNDDQNRGLVRSID